MNGFFYAGYSIFWLMNDFFLHASTCFEAIFMALIKRECRLAKILLQHSAGLGTRSVVFQKPIKNSKTSIEEESLITGSNSHSEDFWGFGLLCQRWWLLKWSIWKCRRSRGCWSLGTWHRTKEGMETSVLLFFLVCLLFPSHLHHSSPPPSLDSRCPYLFFMVICHFRGLQCKSAQCCRGLIGCSLPLLICINSWKFLLFWEG